MKIDLILKISLVTIFCFGSLSTFIESVPILQLSVTLIRYFALLFIILYIITNKEPLVSNKLSKFFIVFFIIYSLIILDNLTIHRLLPLDEMLGVPGSLSSFISRTLFILIILFVSPIYTKIKDFKFLYRWYIVLTLVPVCIYTLIIGPEVLQDTLNYNLTLNSLTLASLSASSILVMIGYKKLWKLSTFEKILFYILLILGIYVLITTAKRGPVLWLIVALLIYYYAISKERPKYILIVCFSLIVLYACGNFILESLKGISPYFIERIQSTIYEGDTSGRFATGDDDSGYALALAQIAEKPWFGSYFRLTTKFSVWSGAYPHNIILEALMTFGIVGLIPFLYFIYKAISNGISAIHNNTSKYIQLDIFFFMIFLSTFLFMMTTGTFLLNITFWSSWMFLLLLNNGKN